MDTEELASPKAKSTTRVRGFAPWRPQADSLLLIEQVKEVLAEYAEHLPLTIRQVFYRLVGTRGYGKTEADYERLIERMNRARRAGYIRFEDLRDDGVHIKRPYMLADLDHGLSNLVATAEAYRLDRQQGQHQRLLVMCEAAGMVPQLERVCDPYSIVVHSTGGFDSVTAKHDLAQQLARDGDSVVLHIGDHDPSGVHIFKSLSEDIEGFLEVLGGRVAFVRLAVTPEQITAMNLPSAVAKASDRRSFDGVAGDQTATVQAEAIPPDMLAQIVEGAIRARMDMDIYHAVLNREAEERARLVSAVSAIHL